MRPTRWPAEVWACALLTLGTLIAFCQVVRFGFVNFDDPVYVYQNLDVQKGFSLDTVLWAFGETHKSAHWHPLTWISLALDWELFGENASAFHATNVLLHLANTLLLFWVLRLSTGKVWRSAVVAGLFGWHPLHVESVAWISERKDVLSTLFWMLTMLVYVMYVKQSANPSGQGTARRLWDLYGLAMLFFACGLLSKSMVVTLPCVLLLWDYWPLRRAPLDRGGTTPVAESTPFGPPRSWRRLFVEKIPLFILAISSGLWTALVMHLRTVRNTGEVVTFPGRVQNALLAVVTLLRKMVWPDDLAAFYPVRLDADYDPAAATTLAAFFVGFVTLFVYLARHRSPYLLMGWLWYVGTLVLVVFRIQTGSITWADRYTYIPMIGIFIAVVWGLCDWLDRYPRVLIVGFTAMLLACLVLTWQQVKVWQDSETLWRHAINVSEENTNFLAHYDLAFHLQQTGRPLEALEHFQKAAEILPHVAKFRLELIRAQQNLARSLRESDLTSARKHAAAALQNLRWLAERTPRDNVTFHENLTRAMAETQQLLKE